MTTLHPFKRAGRVWRVVGRTADADGREVSLVLGGFHQDCGHYHATREEAEACPWEPPLAPGSVYAGLVRQVRDDRADPRMRREQGELFADGGRAA